MKPLACSLLLLVLMFPQPCFSQSKAPEIHFDLMDVDSKASFRGLSVVNDSTVWASGSQATVVNTADGGKTWKITAIAKAGETEFRDIEAFDTEKAFILGAGSPAYVLRTTDGNKSWRLNYSNQHPKIFFDAFAFWNSDAGIGFSDPIDQKLVIIRQYAGGKRLWQDKSIDFPKMYKNEAGFAASGTCLTIYGNQNVWIGLGGQPEKGESPNARVLASPDRGLSWTISESTIPRSASAGIFSLVFLTEKYGVAVGGDYKDPEKASDNISITEDGGKTWRKPTGKFPAGFRSCITAQNVNGIGYVLVATGTNGTDISTDKGESWFPASKTGFHAITFSPDQKASGWASGAAGRIARFKVNVPK